MTLHSWSVWRGFCRNHLVESAPLCNLLGVHTLQCYTNACATINQSVRAKFGQRSMLQVANTDQRTQAGYPHNCTHEQAAGPQVLKQAAQIKGDTSCRQHSQTAVCQCVARGSPSQSWHVDTENTAVRHAPAYPCIPLHDLVKRQPSSQAVKSNIYITHITCICSTNHRLLGQHQHRHLRVYLICTGKARQPNPSTQVKSAVHATTSGFVSLFIKPNTGQQAGPS